MAFYQTPTTTEGSQADEQPPAEPTPPGAASPDSDGIGGKSQFEQIMANEPADAELLNDEEVSSKNSEKWISFIIFLFLFLLVGSFYNILAKLYLGIIITV